VVPELVLIINNVRSAHNVGALLRTADGLGVDEVWLTGYTPYPLAKNDRRLPHLAHKTNRQIAKTALGAEKSVHWQHADDIMGVITELKRAGYTVAALEQTAESIKLPAFKPPDRLALLVGREVEGLEAEVLEICDLVLEIPMSGRKESFNVAAAAAMALYAMRYGN